MVIRRHGCDFYLHFGWREKIKFQSFSKEDLGVLVTKVSSVQLRLKPFWAKQSRIERDNSAAILVFFLKFKTCLKLFESLCQFYGENSSGTSYEVRTKRFFGSNSKMVSAHPHVCFFFSNSTYVRRFSIFSAKNRSNFKFSAENERWFLRMKKSLVVI